MSLDAAIGAAKRGWPAFPVVLVDGKKLPAVKWRAWATTDVGMLAAEWAGRDYPAAGIELERAGLVVIDEDTLGDFQRLANKQGETVPDTYTVRTGRPGGGRQFYFAADGRGVRNTTLLKHIGYDIDVKGAGGYVVAAGSAHSSGAAYTAENDLDPAPIPAWLADVLADECGPTTGTPFELPDRITVGTRDETLWRYACSLRGKASGSPTPCARCGTRGNVATSHRATRTRGKARSRRSTGPGVTTTPRPLTRRRPAPSVTSRPGVGFTLSASKSSPPSPRTAPGRCSVSPAKSSSPRTAT